MPEPYNPFGRPATGCQNLLETEGAITIDGSREQCKGLFPTTDSPIHTPYHCGPFSCIELPHDAVVARGARVDKGTDAKINGSRKRLKGWLSAEEEGRGIF